MVGAAAAWKQVALLVVEAASQMEAAAAAWKEVAVAAWRAAEEAAVWTEAVARWAQHLQKGQKRQQQHPLRCGTGQGLEVAVASRQTWAEKPQQEEQVEHLARHLH